MKKLIESYKINADRVEAVINLWSSTEHSVPLYEIKMPAFGIGTEALISELTEQLSDKVPLNIDEATDTEKAEEQKHAFFLKIREAVAGKMPEANDGDKDAISGVLLHRMFGLGLIDVVMADNWLEELVINGSKQPISIYHRKYGWCKTTEVLKSEEEVYNLSSQIGRKVGREINNLNPIMDAHLLSGDRVASTLFPISTAGNTITIRRFARNPWTPTQLIDPKVKSLSIEMAAFLWQAVQYEMNIMIAGGTASGKTSMLNSICSFIPPTQRIISIEDTREIALPSDLQWNWVPLTTRNQNPEGKGEVTMLDLMVSSLRMRPDRIIVGEVRRKQQAETMFEAMHTGHSVYTTIHADTVEQAKRRLLESPIEIPKAEIEALQLILVQYRDRRRGLRRALELAEIIPGTSDDLQINYLYRWRARTDVFEKANESSRVMEELNLHTGMTQQEIMQDLLEKEKILRWMSSNSVIGINEVGKIMRYYYQDSSALNEAVSRNIKADEFLK
ncbi:type II/IV secretion system ATPase subunit [Candidatus Woesearchaeota archaeon]|nr:type II/IV secretion system ATPase subunit [Candidatus Woesearchaeota archaeon]